MKIENLQNYWDSRYKNGGNSGSGSYGKLCEFKAKVVNGFIAENNIQTVCEIGCGDGNQLSYLNIPEYLGFDISETIVKKCVETFKKDETKKFADYKNIGKYKKKFDLVMSLDVIFHLVDDVDYEKYMDNLFRLSDKYVIIYSSNRSDNGDTAPHVRHRKFTDTISKKYPEFKQVVFIKNEYPIEKFKSGSHSDFYIFQRT